MDAATSLPAFMRSAEGGLLEAAWEGKLACVRALLAAGASPFVASRAALAHKAVAKATKG
jgi:hypothetical protein